MKSAARQQAILIRPLALFAVALSFSVVVFGQASPDLGASAAYGSIDKPRPINPAAGTTNPSARATQNLNPYLGSTPHGIATKDTLRLSLEDAIARGLQYNLGLIDSQETSADAQAQRERALAALLPQISVRAEQTYQQLSYKQLDITLPPQSGIHLPPASPQFGYSEARITAESPVLNFALLNRYRQQKALEAASALDTKDARDVVVSAVGAAYFQVVASQARVDTEEAAVASARELDAQVADQYKSEVSPEIDTLRAHVELHTAEQRLTDAINDLEKDKLTLDRITGIPLEQAWTPAGDYGYVALLPDAPEPSQTSTTRFDVASAKAGVSAAQFRLRAARAERLPEISFNASYGGAGVNCRRRSKNRPRCAARAV